MDDAGAHLPADAGERIAAVVQQGVDERPVRVAGRGVHNKTARFVHHDEIRVLVNNVERDILRRGARRNGRVVLGDEKHVPCTGKLAFFDGLPFPCHLPGCDEPRGGGAGVARTRKESVDPLAALLRLYGCDFHLNSARMESRSNSSGGAAFGASFAGAGAAFGVSLTGAGAGGAFGAAGLALAAGRATVRTVASFCAARSARLTAAEGAAAARRTGSAARYGAAVRCVSAARCTAAAGRAAGRTGTGMLFSSMTRFARGCAAGTPFPAAR